MIYKRSKTITVDQDGVSWKFTRPPGSVLLGWAPQVAELAKTPAEGEQYPITVEIYQEMLEAIAEWVFSVDGEPLEITAEELDAELGVNQTISIWAALFMKAQMGEKEKGKSERQSESASPRTGADDPSTTAGDVGAPAGVH